MQADLQVKGIIQKLDYLRADAGSCFTSEEFISWAKKENINVSLAAPRHQEQNSIAERGWQTLHKMANSMIVRAHLSNHYFYQSHKYASHIMNVLPAKDLYDKNNNPTTPFCFVTHKKPIIGNFRIFGCPAVFKHPQPTFKGIKITKKQQLQRGIRGIFVGFPNNQRGWEFYTEQSINGKHLHTSADAVFDEDFQTAYSKDVLPFYGARKIRSIGMPRDPSINTTDTEETGTLENLFSDFSTFIKDNKDNTDIETITIDDKSHRFVHNCYLKRKI